MLTARTEGNPLFLEESVRALVETGVLAGERGAHVLAKRVEAIEVPATVQAILAARIDRLPPEQKQLLQAASVVGTDVPLELLRAVADLEQPDLSRLVALLTAAELLYEAPLHGRAREEEARETQGTPSAGILRLGETYSLAGRLDGARACAERALGLARTAGERTIEAGALRLLGEVDAGGEPPDAEQSERHFREALAQGEKLGLRPHAARCHLGLGALYTRTGRLEHSEKHLATALAMFREMEMPYWIEKAEGALQALRST